MKNSGVNQGYCIPEPALLVLGQTLECCQLFMTNWLAICPLWISRLDHDPPCSSHPLNSGGRLSKKDLWKKNLRLHPQVTWATSQQRVASWPSWTSLGTSPQPWYKVQHLPQPKLWHGAASTYQSPPLDPPSCLIRAILWEIYKISWCYELCALNQVLLPSLWAEYCRECLRLMHAIFPGSLGLVLWSEALPSKICLPTMFVSFAVFVFSFLPGRMCTHHFHTFLVSVNNQSKHRHMRSFLALVISIYRHFLIILAVPSSPISFSLYISTIKSYGVISHPAACSPLQVLSLFWLYESKNIFCVCAMSRSYLSS